MIFFVADLHDSCLDIKEPNSILSYAEARDFHEAVIVEMVTHNPIKCASDTANACSVLL
jgi:hypothetical protein